MRLIARLMPGNVVSSVSRRGVVVKLLRSPAHMQAFTTCLCTASCVLTLSANPINLVPLFLLSAASLGVQLPVLFMICLHEFQQ